MGCDGGTIPRRDELVRVKKKPEQVDKNAETAAKWKHCAISQQPLRNPIVSCELGKLYNKEAVIEHLLAKSEGSEVAKHIKGLSDVKELKLTENNGYQKKSADLGDEYVDVHASKFICPVSGLEMNGKQKFCFFWKCACVVSEKAIREVKSDVCHKCGSPVSEDDLIILNGSEDEVALMRKKMEARRQKAKLEKKRKKTALATASDEKKQKVDQAQPSTSKAINGVIVKQEPELVNGSADRINSKLMPPPKTQPSASKATNGTTVKQESEEKKLLNGSAKGISSKKLMLPPKAQPEYSISKDPTASAAYKSLFTSSDKAKNQTKAHWVTHNPLYY